MATLAEKLAEAKEARHKLAIGQLARVFMDQNGERVEYTSTNIDALNAYIRELEGILYPSLAGIKQPRPIGFTF